MREPVRGVTCPSMTLQGEGVTPSCPGQRGYSCPRLLSQTGPGTSHWGTLWKGHGTSGTTMG